MTTETANDPLVTFKQALDERNIAALVQECKMLCRKYRKLDWQTGDVSCWLVGIDSDADRFPTGPERESWNKEALAKLDAELAVDWVDLFDEAISRLPELEQLIGK